MIERNINLILKLDEERKTRKTFMVPDMDPDQCFDDSFSDGRGSVASNKLQDIEMIYNSVQSRQLRLTLMDGRWMGI